MVAPGWVGKVRGRPRQEFGDKIRRHSERTRPRQRLQRCNAALLRSAAILQLSTFTEQRSEVYPYRIVPSGP